MVGISITVSPQNEEARRNLRDLMERMDRRTPLFKAIGEQLLKSTKDHFANETAPDG